MITYFKDKNLKSKKKCKNNKTITSMIESVDTVVIFGATTTSATLSVIGVRLLLVPVSAGIACALSLGNKLIHKIIIKKNNKFRKQNKKDHQTIKFFD